MFNGYSKPFVSTFHSFRVYILRQFGSKVGLTKTFTILDRDDSKRKVKDILVAKGHDPKKIEPSKVLSIISKQKGNRDTLAEYTSKTLSGEEGYVGETVAAVWEAYDKELHKEKAVDFDDLLSLPVRILKENPEVRHMLNEKWKYIHVDEYQDTNPIQYERAQRACSCGAAVERFSSGAAVAVSSCCSGCVRTASCSHRIRDNSICTRRVEARRSSKRRDGCSGRACRRGQSRGRVFRQPV